MLEIKHKKTAVDLQAAVQVSAFAVGVVKGDPRPLFLLLAAEGYLNELLPIVPVEELVPMIGTLLEVLSQTAAEFVQREALRHLPLDEAGVN